MADLNNIDEDEGKDVGKKTIVSKKLSNLVNYIESVKFLTLEELVNFRGEGKFYQMSSITEFKATAYFVGDDTNKNFVRYNSRQLSRIYPDTIRQDSSNFDPTLAWNTGCQIGKYNHQF